MPAVSTGTAHQIEAVGVVHVVTRNRCGLAFV
jgi:hypothetical protein